METRRINPTPWLQHFHLNHAVEVTGATRTLYLSGQTASDANGAPIHPGDMAAQFEMAWGNLKDALAAADMGAENVVRLNIYVTDVDAFMGTADTLTPLFAADGASPACTLLGVARLYDPALLVELEATAVA
jgi:enamine deaminase RidA (YjgF/YER057c/UK114 family)